GGGAGGAAGGEAGGVGGGIEEGGAAGGVFTGGTERFSAGAATFAGTGVSSTTFPASTTFRPTVSATPTVSTAILTGVQPIAPSVLSTVVSQPVLSVTGIEGAYIQPYNVSSVANIVGETPIVGAALIRTASIASRFTEPAAPEATRYSASTQHDVVKSFVNLPIALDGLTIPQRTVANNQVSTTMVNLVDFRTTPGNLVSFLNPVVPGATDESHYFSAGVDVLDNAVASLRVLEGRVEGYKQARALAQEALNEVRRQTNLANATLGTIEDALAEARHDVTVGRALLAEETARVTAINRRRFLIIRNHVQYLVFCRPRAVDVLLDTPVRYVDPGLTALPVPSCLSQNVAVPEELRMLVNLLRDVPVKWLPPVLPLIAQLDKVSVLQDTIVGAQQKAQTKVLQTQAVVAQALQSSAGLFGESISNVYSAQARVVSDSRATLVQMDTKQLKVENWSNTVEFVAAALSPGDLMDAAHGRIELAQQTAQHLDNIAKVAACLYAEFGAVLPAIRLGWAERLSQYDTPVILKNLANLPRWHEIEFTDRREMQQLVDWLFQQVDNQQREAYDIMNDLIRVCILLASHAPVNQIIAGHVPKPVVVRPGHLVNLGGDILKLNVGMHVLMYQGNTVAARGIVEDLGKQGIATRVTQTITESVQLEQNAQVHYVSAQNAPLNTIAASTKLVKMQMR
ncbi:MAG: hypothetical protein K8L91_00660, partial [Anaerolineae bacterium]|nr:hypothetical protein [Anaerolineae bacterium]